MEVINTNISGLLIISPSVFEDERGYFYESYNKAIFEKNGIIEEFIQDNQSKSNKGVLRGMHFQNPPYAQSKLVRVIKGSVLDVALDIRKNSPTYGKYFSLIIDEYEKKMLYIPVGFAHGFLTLEDNTIFTYKCSNKYNKEAEDTLLWSDSDLNIAWNIANPTISDKDKKGKPFANFISKF
ncbi:MAG: dTDP-4-dehydrorhamnose 3,5-epimerase [Bacteroidetes bacterium CG2_30_32_10]|nr:MAG: dTDP-4-dehydrorhamnose 3,5-epimerase [Bacteroidetes bacterium CG2_30_32_10]